jgi:hypothetical protein
MHVRTPAFDAASGYNPNTNNASVNSSASTNDDNRCIYHFPSGRRCRQALAPDNPQFCLTHAGKTQLLAPADETLGPELIEAAGELSDPEEVRKVMLKVFRAMAQRRISGKDAGVICYIAQTILHCHRDTAYNRKLETEAKRNRIVRYIDDLPGPESE